MKKIIQFGFATIIWGVVLMCSPSSVVKVFGLAFMPMVCAAFAILGTMLPGLFEMGIQGFKTANIVEKMAPIVVVLALCYGVTLIPQTYATAITASIFLGNTTSYIGSIVGGFFN